MRAALMALGCAFAMIGTALPQAACAAEQRKQVTAEDLAKTSPDATLEFEGKQLALSWAAPAAEAFCIARARTISSPQRVPPVGGTGVSEVHATGTVHNLKKVEDSAGAYTGVGAGATALKGKGASQFENSKGRGSRMPTLQGRSRSNHGTPR